MISPLLIIASITLLVAVSINKIFKSDSGWFNRLRRPQWLTFEWAIPFIWIFVFICGVYSAYQLWIKQPGTTETWLLMAGYLLLEILIMAYTPIMCKLRSLQVGTIIGATGFFWGLILAVLLWPISQESVFLLLPYLLWSPIGTYVTWEMISLNPLDK
ncbi:TspO/MBR family protein [Crocosphaera subtropica]|uniref:TspO/MBR family protein n=1 Tax=Crocosphaera subtropica TaxID=2546360 RepID=UPI00023142FF|nr:TspO/MBR family protein [Crocosphaera subtropica]